MDGDDGIYDDSDSDDSDSSAVVAGDVIPDSVTGKRKLIARTTPPRTSRPASAAPRASSHPDAHVDLDATQSTPRVRLVPRAIGKNDEHVKESLRRSFNQCPICKMPLNIDTRWPDNSIAIKDRWDSKWQTVQAWFKCKPAICLNDRKRARNIQVFGIIPTIGLRATNTNDCHYLHKSASNGGATFNGIWNQCTDVSSRDAMFKVNVLTVEGDKPLAFIRKLTRPYSIFQRIPDLANGLLFTPDYVNTVQLNELVVTLTSRTFAGCWDCNQRMTQMNWVPEIFKSIFGNYKFDTTFDTDKKEMRLNAQMNYLLLAMQLEDANLFKPDGSPYTDAVNNKCYRIGEQVQRTWRFKLAIAWCIIMIIFSHWSNVNLDPRFKHHEDYIYNGTSDFYLSLLLYTVYIANYPSPAFKEPLKFEEFHFFYTTNFVFFLKHRGVLKQTAEGGNSLSLAVLHNNAMMTTDAAGNILWAEVLELDMPRFDPKKPVESTSACVEQVFRKAVEFVGTFFQPFCAQLYALDWTQNDQWQFSAYFTSPTDAELLVARTRSTKLMNVQEFATLLTPRMYWYHFKHITMQQIAVSLGKGYDEMLDIFHPIFNSWCRQAFAKVNALGSRLPLSLMDEHRLACRADEDENDAGLLLCRKQMRALTC